MSILRSRVDCERSGALIGTQLRLDSQIKDFRPEFGCFPELRYEIYQDGDILVARRFIMFNGAYRANITIETERVDAMLLKASAEINAHV